MKILIALLAILAVAGWGQQAEGLYKSKCAACHAADGSGDTPAGKKLGVRDFHLPEVQKQTDAELGETTAKGKSKMPAYEKQLKPEEIRGLVGYIRELGKKRKAQ